MSTILHVKVATTEYLNLGVAVPGASIDGVSLLTGDLVLVKAQGMGYHIDNGIYEFQSDQTLDRASIMAAAATIDTGQLVVVLRGDLFGNTGWMLTSANATTTIGTNALAFERFTVSANILDVDIPSSIILRAEKGTPLSIGELDNNFKFLTNGLVNKLNISDFNTTSICAAINSVEYSVSGIDAATLATFTLDANSTANTVVRRDANSKITSAAFIGALEGNATSATTATTATLAGNVTGVVAVANGGTGSSTAKNARIALGVVGVGGVDDNAPMTGKLNLMPGTNSVGSINLGVGVEPLNVNNRVNGDLWASTNLKYMLGNSHYTIATLESPTFTGVPSAPNPGYSSNTTLLATTKFVQDHHAVIDASIATRAPIVSPSFTGTPLSPTPDVNDNSTKIATTAYTRGYVAATVPLMPSITGKVSKSGDTMTGALTLSEHPTSGSPALQAATKGYIDTRLSTTTYGSFMLSTEYPNGEVLPPSGYTMANLKGFLPAFGSTVQVPPRTNLILMIDNSGSATSGSMTFGSPPITYTNTLQAEIVAAKHLVNYYASIGTTAVCIYYTNNLLGTMYKWTNAADAIVLLTSLSTTGFLSGTVPVAFSNKTQVANNNVVYFLTDAEHSHTSFTAIGGSESIWKSFLNANSITSFAVAIGNTGTESNINIIAWDGKTSSELYGIKATTLTGIPTTPSTSTYYNGGNITYSLQPTKVVVSFAGILGTVATVAVNWLAIWSQ